MYVVCIFVNQKIKATPKNPNMDIDPRCDDFLLSSASTSSKTGVDNSSGTFQNRPAAQNVSAECELPPGDFMTTSSSSSISGRFSAKDDSCLQKETVTKAPNISYELAVAKSVMQQLSSISGDNLFDHLSDIIKRVIDERPPNVIDFFEEFSRNVREQKFHLPERFPPHAVYEAKRSFKAAKEQLIAMKLPYSSGSFVQNKDELEEEHSKDDMLNLELNHSNLAKFRTFNGRVQYLQFYWNQCGLSISSEDIFQLACSMNRLQTHPSIMQCRFWGMINGLKASYYIVEATLTKDEYESRLLQMKKETHEHFMSGNMENENMKKLPAHIGPELIPGAVGWENQSEEDILKMKPSALPVPLMTEIKYFDIPSEPIGKGVNRYSYFVVNSLSDEWTELPIVTPKQISQSRDIKKFFTGDLEADIISYPCFGGKEKHYLRAMIARITAGTYIAPKNYYRKITKKERQLLEGGKDDGEDVAEEEEDSQIGEEENNEQMETDNDVILVKNENYNYSMPLLHTLSHPEQWVHVRPNILLQGRVVWYDQQKAERERDKEHKLLARTMLQEEMNENESSNTGEEDDDDEEDEDEESEEEPGIEVQAEKGPAILSPCSGDINNETSTPWVARFTSNFTNQNERILLMQSNVWPGAYTFTFRDICDSIYLGWGHKSVSRNQTWKHLPPVEKEYRHDIGDFIETIDPRAQMEEMYKLNLLKREFEKMKDFDEHAAPESSNDEEGDDEEDEDED